MYSEDELKVTVRIPLETADELKKTAKEHLRSFNGELVWAIQQYLSYGRKTTNK